MISTLLVNEVMNLFQDKTLKNITKHSSIKCVLPNAIQTVDFDLKALGNSLVLGSVIMFPFYLDFLLKKRGIEI